MTAYVDTDHIHNRLRDEPEMAERRGWLTGEWDNEPDRRYWVNEDGQPCLIVRGPLGALCGYVAVPPGHPFHGRDYSDVPNEVHKAAHGGLTYADPCQEGVPEGEGICHVPEPGQPDDVWWFGFDCAHSGDLAPGMGRVMGYDTYKDISYVQRHVEALAEALRAAA